MNNSNDTLANVYDKNMDYYEMLEKYRLAGKVALEGFEKQLIPGLEGKAKGGDQRAQLELNNAKQVAEMLSQRVYDLQLAKSVSMQTAVQVKMIQNGNYNLIRKINSAFIITIPLFKQGLVQAMELKKQSIVADATKALDDKTNELLRQNAENVANQSKMAAELASRGSVDIETLEQTWKTIMDGIAETKRIEQENRQKREEGEKKIEEIHTELRSKKDLLTA
jgi:uncharacterized protein YaaN involved in tellurite resistance